MTRSIWIKINNPTDNPREWIQNGYISISDYHGNEYIGRHWLEDADGKYNFVTKLQPGCYIYMN